MALSVKSVRVGEIVAAARAPAVASPATFGMVRRDDPAVAPEDCSVSDNADKHDGDDEAVLARNNAAVSKVEA